jgi:hypothetical protein
LTGFLASDERNIEVVMMRLLFSFFLLALVFACPAEAQRSGGEVEIWPRKKAPLPTRPPAKPRGSMVPSSRSNGVLFVITNPPSAEIVIKNNQGETVKQSRANDGELRAELPAGPYLVQVTSSDLAPFSSKVILRPGGIRVVTADLKFNSGSIVIGPIEPDAVIFIDGEKVAEWKRNENMAEIEDVLPGKHLLRITHPNMAAYEKEIVVQASSTTIVMPRFAPAPAELLLKSNPGAAVYINGMFHGKVLGDGTLKLTKMHAGEHELKLVKDGYDDHKEKIKIQPGDSVLEKPLKMKKMYAGIADFFMDGGSLWTLPKSWQVTSGKMLVRGPEIGLVADRVYKDFRLEFDITLLNGKGAVWVIRARDENNYYVFQLSGDKGVSPNTFRSYLCRDGKIQLLKTTTVAEDISQPNDSLHIVVEAKGNQISHFIETASRPHEGGIQPLDVLTDTTLSHGRIGFSTKDNEEFIVYLFVAEPIMK